jgi:hypothetical protein
MKTRDDLVSLDAAARPNGSGAAAVLSAGAGSLALAMLAFVADKSSLIKSSLVFYRPTGPLSGVTTIALLLWLCIWVILEWRWRGRTLAMRRIVTMALALLGLSLLLTFPPFVDLF